MMSQVKLEALFKGEFELYSPKQKRFCNLDMYTHTVLIVSIVPKAITNLYHHASLEPIQCIYGCPLIQGIAIILSILKFE